LKLTALVFWVLLVLPVEAEVSNRIIYFIHGDGDYLYHDNLGNKMFSDQMILQQAIENAEKGINSEYFIFHLKPERRFLFFFPTEESDFYHYREGKLINQLKYFRYEPVDGHSAESHLITNSSSDSADKKRNILLYYGHEIPLEESYGYNYSFRSVPFGLESFSGRLKELLTVLEITRFDLLILSTCNNGSPAFISELSSLADFIVAAPGDLHLSQMNSSSLLMLEDDPNIETKTLAGHFAATAFNTLTQNALTEIVIAVYDTRPLTQGNDFTQNACEDSVLPDGNIRVFFQPAKFGRDKNKAAHTGWYCK
jgi:hypothetical protein